MSAERFLGYVSWALSKRHSPFRGSGEDLIGRFVDAKDNPGFTRCFCRHCGSVVPKLSRNQKFWVVPSGLLDSDPEMRPQANIFWEEHAPWYVPVGQISTFEGPYVERSAAANERQ